jgi:hypothetical protein
MSVFISSHPKFLQELELTHEIKIVTQSKRDNRSKMSITKYGNQRRKTDIIITIT